MKRYEIWRAKVKFEDSDEIKQRPVLIWNDLAFIIAYKMTGTNRGGDNEKYSIQYWQEAGLSKPTCIRLDKVLKLRRDDLLYKMGELDKRERLSFEFCILP